MLQTPTILIKLAQVLNLPAEKIAELFKEIFWQEISPGEMNRLLHLLLEKVEVHESKLTVGIQEFRYQNSYGGNREWRRNRLKFWKTGMSG